MYILFIPGAITFVLIAIIQVVSEIRGGKSNL